MSENNLREGNHSGLSILQRLPTKMYCNNLFKLIVKGFVLIVQRFVMTVTMSFHSYKTISQNGLAVTVKEEKLVNSARKNKMSLPKT